MGALAVHADDAGVGAGHGRPRNDGEAAFGQAGHVVHREHGVTRKQVEEALFDHAPRATAALLGRLEDDMDGAVELARGGQMSRRGQQHRRVPVVPARVHLAEDLAGPGLAAGLLHRQRVHVGADADAARTRSMAKGADHPRAAQATVHLPAPTLQAFGHQRRRHMLFIGQFRLRVDLAPDLDHLGLLRAQRVKGGRRGGWLHRNAPQALALVRRYSTNNKTQYPANMAVCHQ